MPQTSATTHIITCPRRIHFRDPSHKSRGEYKFPNSPQDTHSFFQRDIRLPLLPHQKQEEEDGAKASKGQLARSLQQALQALAAMAPRSHTLAC